MDWVSRTCSHTFKEGKSQEDKIESQHAKNRVGKSLAEPLSETGETKPCKLEISNLQGESVTTPAEVHHKEARNRKQAGV